MKQFWIILSIVAAVFTAALCVSILATAGCAASTAPVHSIPLDPTVKGGSLYTIAVSLDWLILLGVVVTGALVGFYFTPEGHTISSMLVLPAAGVLATSAFTRIVLPYGGIIAIVLSVAALGVGIYEFIKNRKSAAPLTSAGIIAAAQAAGSEVAAKL